MFVFLAVFDDFDLKESARDELFEDDACEAALETGRAEFWSGLGNGAEVGARGRGFLVGEPNEALFDGKRERV